MWSSSMASTQHPRDIKIQECVFRADRKSKMTALSESEWLRYIRLSLRTEFDQTWQEASAQCLLQVSLCFSDQSKNKDDHPCRRLWLTEGFSTSPLQSLAERNLTKLDMKQVFNVYQVSGVRFFLWLFWGEGGGVDRNSRKTNMYELSTLRHAVLVMISQLCGSLQGFALFHIITSLILVRFCSFLYQHSWHVIFIQKAKNKYYFNFFSLICDRLSSTRSSN